MQQTPLHSVHERLGARMVEFGGWHMPVQYGPILDEVRCVREKVGLFDLSHMGRFRLTGADRISALDKIVTTFVGRIPVDSIRYGLICQEDGGALDDILVYRGEEDVFLVVNASNTERDMAWLKEHLAGANVSLEDQTDELAMLALQGQDSVATLQTVVEDLDLLTIGYYKSGFGTLCGLPNVRVSRTGYTGEDGFEIYFDSGESERVWNALMEAGAQYGLKPIGLGARDTLRLEAGMSLYGHEISETRNPIEAGLSFGISFHEDKGDWIGRDALAQIKANPTNKLVGVTTDGKRAPREGYPVMSGDEQIGVVCSGAISPTLSKNIGTAYVPLAFSEAGTKVQMDLRGKRQDLTVTDLPFYSRKR
ncbi:MAG: glycine cleavage system protein T [Planctomycetes bacterium]|nr:glycine cleavage system protein T [Planctomycetota bacterium]